MDVWFLYTRFRAGPTRAFTQILLVRSFVAFGGTGERYSNSGRRTDRGRRVTLVEAGRARGDAATSNDRGLEGASNSIRRTRVDTRIAVALRDVNRRDRERHRRNDPTNAGRRR